MTMPYPTYDQNLSHALHNADLPLLSQELGTFSTERKPIGISRSARVFSRLLLVAGIVVGTAGAYAAPLDLAQVTALQNLYTSTNGNDWTDSTNWNIGTNPCAATTPWFGITCDTGGDNVTGIDLRNNKLSGMLLSLDAFPALTYFHVRGNQITGSLPSLTGLPALQEFHANENLFTGGIPSLAGLSALTYFDVSVNLLGGPLPALAGLTNLEQFYSSRNQLTGPLPSLAGLTALNAMYVNSNLLTGVIPSLADTQMGAFRVNNNLLTGPLPAAPATLTANDSLVCKNNLSLPSPADAAWNAAAGNGGTWWAPVGVGNDPCWADITPTVTSAAASGTITPDVPQTPVAPMGPGGAATAFTLTAAAGYEVDTVSDNCGDAGASIGSLVGDVYTVTGPYGNCTVSASYQALATPPGGNGADITPVPTLNQAGLGLLALLMAGGFAWTRRQRS